MPPKAKKAVEKAKAKVAEDKTFGLKNKKGKQQQKFVQQVQAAVKGGDPRKDKEKEEAKKKKEQAEKDKLLINSLFKPVVQEQKVAPGSDPKSVLCAFFKKGQCTKGDKCKFSHDLAVERKAAKRNIYEEAAAEGGEAENMDNWDQAKLEDVVNKKGGEGEALKPKTAIICKYFLEALEDSKYGWFWNCPNGDTCQYRHVLPQGYVLKKDKKKQEDEENKITLEELIETERQSLDQSKVTRVTLETFMAWKKKKILEKKRLLKEQQALKKKNFKEGRAGGTVTGRELFTFNPDMAAADDADADTTKYERTDYDDEELSAAAAALERVQVEGESEAGEAGEAGEADAAEGSHEEGGAAAAAAPAGPRAPVVAFDASVFATDLDDLDDLEDDDDEGAASGGAGAASAASAAAAAAGDDDDEEEEEEEEEEGGEGEDDDDGGAAVAGAPLDAALFEDLGNMTVED